ncbi:MAG: TatD family hydrolase [Acidobacteria bacterium]|nr:TatD family hydrolase [Acidobacteriota bacterium]
MIFDTHCHGYWHGLKHRQTEMLDNMRAMGVVRSVHIGTDIDKSLEALSLARAWGSDTWYAAGFHPTGCQNLPPLSAAEHIRELEKLAQNSRDKIVGIGETGLDYFHLTRGHKETQKQTQREFFRHQAELSLRLDLPLIVHTRDAAADTISILKESGIRRAVIHCYSENPKFARELLNFSDEIYFSFSGMLTYQKSTAVQDTARELRLDRILVETDAPFLVPQAVRNVYKINEPAFTRHVMDFLKTLRSEPGDVVEQTVWKNSHRFLRIAE